MDASHGRAPMRLVCASANPDKVAEIREILERPVDGARLVSLEPRPDSVPDVVEDADTLLGNARLKARAIADATGRAAVADDTGLFVDALDGAPGVYSARYAGEGCTYADNRHKLLAALSGSDDRTASFRTVAIIVWPDGSELAVEGVCPGIITGTERGARGFGYDAVFAPDEADGSTFAEMSADAKHAISHRGRAFRALLVELARR
jgi:XTP/dITP diphosphohydrolase